jgi:hypothetical protein
MDERLRRLLGPGRPELSCEECFTELPRFVELEILEGAEFDLCSACTTAGSCATERDCLRMRAHLEGCAACGEEHAVLRQLVLGGRAE